MPDPDLLRLYAKLAGYQSVNAYTQSAFDTLADQWRNHPEVQALLRKKAGQKTQALEPLSFDEARSTTGSAKLRRNEIFIG